MKQMTSTKIVSIAKTVTVIGSNFGIFTLSFASLASLVLLLGQFDLVQVLPKGVEMTFSGYEAWGGVNAFVMLFVAANTIMTYGLMKLKTFAKIFQINNLFEESTISFLKKGAILMTVVGTLRGVTEFVINPAHIILNFSVAGWLLIASWVLTYLRNRFVKEVA